MGFGKTPLERQLALIVYARAGEQLVINDILIRRTEAAVTYHEPSQSFIYNFHTRDDEMCEAYIRVRFVESEGNLSLPHIHRRIKDFIEGQIIFIKEYETEGREIFSVKEG